MQAQVSKFGFFFVATALLWCVGVGLYFKPENVATIWPLCGLAAGFLIFEPVRRWPLYLIGLFGINVALNLTSYSTGFAVMAALTNVAEPLLVAGLIRRFVPGVFRMDRPRSLYLFLAVATAGALGGALMGGLALIHSLEGLNLWAVMQIWFFSDLLGLLAVTPLVLGWHAQWPLKRPLGRGRYRFELGAVLAALGLLTIYLFSGMSGRLTHLFEFPYIILLAFVWIAYRFEHHISVFLNLLLAVGFIYATGQGLGPFANSGDTYHQAIAVQSFVMVTIVAALLAGAMVSENRWYYAGLQRLERRFRTVFENAPVAIAIVDSGGRIIDANPMMGRLLDLEPTKLAGRNLSEFVLSSASTQAQPIPTGVDFTNRECKIQRADGDMLWGIICQSVVSKNLISPQGDSANQSPTPGSFYSIIQILDITAQVNAGHEARELQKQLFHAQKMESLGRFAGGIAHDFNNLLVPIVSLSEMLVEDNVTDQGQVKKISRSILDSAMLAAGLTRQLLSFIRKNDGDNLALVDINTIIYEALEVSALAFGGSIEVNTKLGTIPKIHFDSGQLHQVLTNLFVNAKDAMPQGGTISVSTALKPMDWEQGFGQPEDCIEVVVADTGLGMSPEVQSRIFEPFFTTKSLDRGTGLGLSTVYGIITKHGGDIKVDSHPGQGTRFTIRIPLKFHPAAHQLGLDPAST